MNNQIERPGIQKQGNINFNPSESAFTPVAKPIYTQIAEQTLSKVTDSQSTLKRSASPETSQENKRIKVVKEATTLSKDIEKIQREVLKLRDKKDYDKALLVCKDGLNLYAKDIQLNFLHINCLLKKQLFQQAEVELEKVSSWIPKENLNLTDLKNFISFRYYQAYVHKKSERPGQALEILNQIIDCKNSLMTKVQEDLFAIRELRARVHFSLKKFDEALSDFLSLPGAKDYFSLASIRECYRGLKKYEEALNVFNEIKETNKIGYLFGQLETFYLLNDIQNAEKIIESIQELSIEQKDLFKVFINTVLISDPKNQTALNLLNNPLIFNAGSI